MQTLPAYTAFLGNHLLHHGRLADVAQAIKALTADVHPQGVLIFDNASGRVVDVDFRGSAEEVLARLPVEPEVDNPPTDEVPRGPGRPKLGVVAKEVTLLPRHWEWLAEQPGGASVALRKLVEDARRAYTERDRLRTAREAVYRFISVMLGNAPGLEEAERALFAGKRDAFEQASTAWPEDLRTHAMLLAEAAFAGDPA